MVILVAAREGLDPALEEVRRTVEDFDRACSSFRQDSELSALNQAAGAPVSVSPLLLEAIEAALAAADATDGDVDPTVGEALVALGFTPALGAGRPRQSPRIARVRGYQAIDLDRVAGTVRVPRGVRLDLGATAKALAADRAALAAHAAAGCGVLVSLMGDLAVAGPAPEGGWRVRVTDDHRSRFEAPGQWISVNSGGLATSTVTVRAGAGGHHVIDPATGRPAGDFVRTVSVAAGSCLEANTASTAAIVRGPRAADWLRSLGLPSRLVSADGGVEHLAGWPAEGDDLRMSTSLSPSTPPSPPPSPALASAAEGVGG
jgi:thiamine biosynthesis lipoprotein